jgi:hypothetical protein
MDLAFFVEPCPDKGPTTGRDQPPPRKRGEGPRLPCAHFRSVRRAVACPTEKKRPSCPAGGGTRLEKGEAYARNVGRGPCEATDRSLVPWTNCFGRA